MENEHFSCVPSPELSYNNYRKLPRKVLNKVLSLGGTQQIFTGIIPAPGSMSLPFHISCLTEKVLLSYTIPSLLAVEEWGGLLQAF